jgi:Flp pilus assembly pilin Flp
MGGPLLSILSQRLAALAGLRGERAQALLEYALILCLVVIVILIALIVLGNQVRNTYCNIGGAVISA